MNKGKKHYTSDKNFFGNMKRNDREGYETLKKLGVLPEYKASAKAVVAVVASVAILGTGGVAIGTALVKSAATNAAKSVIGMEHGDIATDLFDDMIGNIVSEFTGLDDNIIGAIQSGIDERALKVVIPELLKNYTKSEVTSFLKDYAEYVISGNKGSFESYIANEGIIDTRPSREVRVDNISYLNYNDEIWKSEVTSGQYGFRYDSKLDEPLKRNDKVGYVKMTVGGEDEILVPMTNLSEFDIRCDKDSDYIYIMASFDNDHSRVEHYINPYQLSYDREFDGIITQKVSYKWNKVEKVIIDKFTTDTQYWLVAENLAVPCSKRLYNKTEEKQILTFIYDDQHAGTVYALQDYERLLGKYDSFKDNWELDEELVHYIE